MLKKVKKITLEVLNAAGVFDLVCNSRWRSDRLLIIGYHGLSILDEHIWDPQLFMHPDVFEQRLELIKRNGYHVLPLNEAVERLYANDLPKKSLALTFDDGFYDFYKYGHPILKSYGFPSTLYLTTYYVDYNRPIFDAVISYLLWKGRSRTLNLGRLIGKEVTVDLSNDEARSAVSDEILAFAPRTRMSGAERDALAARLAAELHQDYEQLCEMRILHLLKPEEARALAADGVDIELHTHTHRTPSDRALFSTEIEMNRDSIRVMTGETPHHFCYPSGRYKKEFFAWLDELGISTATTCDVELADSESNRLLLPRLIDTSLSSPIEFEGWLSGLASFLPRGNKSAGYATT